MKSEILFELVELFSPGMKFLGNDMSHPASKKLIQKHLEKELKLFDSGGGLFLQLRDNKKLRAAIILRKGSALPIDLGDHNQWSFRIFTKPGDQKALKWVENQLHHFKPFFRGEIDGSILPWQSALLKPLNKMGIYPISLTLEGRVKAALKALEKNYTLKQLLGQEVNHFTAKPISTKEEIECYLKIIKSEFTKNPQFGHFVAHPTFMKMLRDEMNKALEKKATSVWVFKVNGKVVGGFDYQIGTKGFSGRRRASCGLNFDEKFHGKGLAKVAYYYLLKDLRTKKIDQFQGGTAQVGVMKLGVKMGRKLTGVHMKKVESPFFKEGYLENWIRRYE